MKRNLLKLISLVIAIVLLTATLGSCEKNKPAERKSKIYYAYFDTVATLYDFSGDEESIFDANCRAFEEEISLCHKLFDIYHSYEGIVNIKDINDAAGGEALTVDVRLIELLEFSVEMYEKTNGAVNIAMGSVLKIWHTYRELGTSIPAEDELLSAAQHCDISKIEIDKEKRTVRLADPEMLLDVGAVAKGFAIDRAVSVLRSRGAESYAVDIGGNLYAIGSKADGTAFKTGVENPDGGDYPCIIDVVNGAVATSGDYQRFYTVGGVSYHHIINSETLYPSRFHRSVTVYSNSAALSDALSTALFNTESYSVAKALISAVPGVREVIFIEADGSVERIKP